MKGDEFSFSFDLYFVDMMNRMLFTVYKTIQSLYVPSAPPS